MLNNISADAGIRTATKRQLKLIRALLAQLSMTRSKALDAQFARMSAAEASKAITRLLAAVQARRDTAVPAVVPGASAEPLASTRMIRYIHDLKAQLGEFVDADDERNLQRMTAAEASRFSKRLQQRVADREDYEGRTPKWRRDRGPAFVNLALVSQGQRDRAVARAARIEKSTPSKCTCPSCSGHATTTGAPADPELMAFLDSLD